MQCCLPVVAVSFVISHALVDQLLWALVVLVYAWDICAANLQVFDYIMTSMAQYKHNRSRMMALIAEHAPAHGHSHSAALAEAHAQQVPCSTHCNTHGFAQATLYFPFAVASCSNLDHFFCLCCVLALSWRLVSACMSTSCNSFRTDRQHSGDPCSPTSSEQVHGSKDSHCQGIALDCCGLLQCTSKSIHHHGVGCARACSSVTT